MNSNKLTVLVLCFFGLFSCRTKDDTHSEVPYFSKNEIEGLSIEVLDGGTEVFLSDTDDYIFTFMNDLDVEGCKVKVRDKKTKHEINEIKINSKIRYLYDVKNIDIDTIGNVYFLETKGIEEKCYKATPPLFKIQEIKSLDISFLSSLNVEKDSEEVLKQIVKDSSWAYKKRIKEGIIYKRQKKLLEQRLLNNYEHIFLGKRILALRNKNESEYFVKLDYSGANRKIKGIPIPNKKNMIFHNVARSKKTAFISSKLKLSNFDDSVLLDYDLKWNNSGKLGSLIPNYYSDKIHYYEIKIDGKSFKCKSNSLLQKSISFNNDILIEGYNRRFRISVE